MKKQFLIYIIFLNILPIIADNREVPVIDDYTFVLKYNIDSIDQIARAYSYNEMRSGEVLSKEELERRMDHISLIGKITAWDDTMGFVRCSFLKTGIYENCIIQDKDHKAIYKVEQEPSKDIFVLLFNKWDKRDKDIFIKNTGLSF